MPTEKETELYFAARNRALERHLDTIGLRTELEDGFSSGYDAVSPAYKDSGADDPALYLPRMKSETNFAFGFVLGMMARLEAVKGKGYQASWQRRGEIDGAMVNIERKYDRLDATVRHGAEGESVCQILGDLSVYSLKWLVLRAELNPEEFTKLIKEIQGI